MGKRLFFHDDDNWRGQLFTLFMLLFVFGWIFWAFQLDRPGVFLTNRQVRQERINRDAVIEYGSKIVAKADKLGESFGPTQCYAYFRRLYLKDSKLHHPTIGGTECRPAVSGRLEHLMKSLDQNQQKLSGKQAEEFAMERYREADRFRVWQAKYCPPPAVIDGIAKSFRKVGWLGVLGWLAILYLRSIVMSSLLYLLVIAKRDGFRAVIPTICRQKARYVIASIAWPAFFWRFPYNILRELWVEAQLRRFGDLFRWLTPDEREKVRVIANSSAYKGWMVEHRRLHAGLPQRWLLVALLGTILFNLILPVLGSEKHTRPIRGPAEIHQTIRDGTGEILYESSPPDHQDQDGGTCQHWVCPANLVEVSQPDTIYWIVQVEILLTSVFERAVDHVPVSRPAVSIASN